MPPYVCDPITRSPAYSPSLEVDLTLVPVQVGWESKGLQTCSINKFSNGVNTEIFNEFMDDWAFSGSAKKMPGIIYGVLKNIRTMLEWPAYWHGYMDRVSGHHCFDPRVLVHLSPCRRLKLTGAISTCRFTS